MDAIVQSWCAIGIMGSRASWMTRVGHVTVPGRSRSSPRNYWIVRNTVRWARRWSPEEVAAGRMHDAAAKGEYFGVGITPERTGPAAPDGVQGEAKPREGRWQRLKKWLGFGGQ